MPTKDINPSHKACRNVEEFIKYFPNFVKLQQTKHFILFDEINNLEVTKKINDYIDFISEKINKKDLSADEHKIIKEKIYDFILSKLYDKLYPKNPDTDLSFIYRLSSFIFYLCQNKDNFMSLTILSYCGKK